LKVEEYVIQEPSRACDLLFSGFFVGLFVDPEDGEDMFLRNMPSFSMDFTEDVTS
jgi:hypothetical protein